MRSGAWRVLLVGMVVNFVGISMMYCSCACGVDAVEVGNVHGIDTGTGSGQMLDDLDDLDDLEEDEEEEEEDMYISNAARKPKNVNMEDERDDGVTDNQSGSVKGGFVVDNDFEVDEIEEKLGEKTKGGGGKISGPHVDDVSVKRESKTAAGTHSETSTGRGSGEAEWDPDEFEGFPTDDTGVNNKGINNDDDDKGTLGSTSITEHADKKKGQGQDSGSRRTNTQHGENKRDLNVIIEDLNKKYVFEAIALVMLLFYGINYLYGKHVNSNKALLFANSLTEILDQNFALQGVGNVKDKDADDSNPNEANNDADAGEKHIITESASEYKIYATGRRYCEGMLITLNLVPRQDLLSLLLSLVRPVDDMVTIEVYMNANHSSKQQTSSYKMPQSVLVIAEKKIARNLQKNNTDVTRYTKPMHLSEGGSNIDNINNKLLILGESREFLNDVCTSHLVNNLLTSQQAVAKSCGRYFVSLYISDQMDAAHKEQIRMSFRLPPQSHHENANGSMSAKLVNFVPHIIDTIGRTTLSEKARQKAEYNRKLVAADLERERQQASLNDSDAATGNTGKNVKEMTEKEREKHEKKMKKREQRKMMGRVKIMRS